jgi:single-stranded DNA-binding protein
MKRITIDGQVQSAPEARTGNNEKMVTGFIVSHGDDENSFLIECQAYGKTAEVANSLTPGQSVCLAGELRITVSETESGKKNKTPQIIVNQIHLTAQGSISPPAPPSNVTQIKRAKVAPVAPSLSKPSSAPPAPNYDNIPF